MCVLAVPCKVVMYLIIAHIYNCAHRWAGGRREGYAVAGRMMKVLTQSLAIRWPLVAGAVPPASASMTQGSMAGMGMTQGPVVGTGPTQGSIAGTGMPQGAMPGPGMTQGPMGGMTDGPMAGATPASMGMTQGPMGGTVAPQSEVEPPYSPPLKTAMPEPMAVALGVPAPSTPPPLEPSAPELDTSETRLAPPQFETFPMPQAPPQFETSPMPQAPPQEPVGLDDQSDAKLEQVWHSQPTPESTSSRGAPRPSSCIGGVVLRGWYTIPFLYCSLNRHCYILGQRTRHVHMQLSTLIPS